MYYKLADMPQAQRLAYLLRCRADELEGMVGTLRRAADAAERKDEDTAVDLGDYADREIRQTRRKLRGDLEGYFEDGSHDATPEMAYHFAGEKAARKQRKYLAKKARALGTVMNVVPIVKSEPPSTEPEPPGDAQP